MGEGVGCYLSFCSEIFESESHAASVATALVIMLSLSELESHAIPSLVMPLKYKNMPKQ